MNKYSKSYISALLSNNHQVLAKEENEMNCNVGGEPWVTYFENHYLGKYSAIQPNLRIYKRKNGKLVALYLNRKGKSTKSPLKAYLRKVDRKIRDGISPTAPEYQHLKQHLRIRLVEKHQREIRAKLEKEKI